MYETDNGRRARSVYASRSLASNLQFYQYILLDLFLYIHFPTHECRPLILHIFIQFERWSRVPVPSVATSRASYHY